MGGRSPDDYRTTYAGRICLLRMPVKATPDSANIAVIPCFGLARQKLPYVQTLAGDGNWPISECRLTGG